MGLKIFALGVTAATIGLLSPATASNYNPLHEFHGSDGAYPSSAVVEDAQGNLYGTTPSGARMDAGDVFELKPAGSRGGHWNEKVLHKFSGPGARGPFGPLIFDGAGNLFGTTTGSGANSLGSVFELSPPTRPGGSWKESDIYSFSGGNDGAIPYAGVTIDVAGNLYGTTIEGGGAGCKQYGFLGCGTVFRLTPPLVLGGAWTETILHRFHGRDGREPYAGLAIDPSGNLFGTTIDGGAASDAPFLMRDPQRPFLPIVTGYDGVVFEVSPPSHRGGRWVERVLHSFGQRGDGANPYSTLMFDNAGNLFGTTVYGGLASCFFLGATCGTVFELSPAQRGSWKESIIYEFSSGAQQGAAPYAGVAFDSAGNIFGTTQLGGIQTQKHVYGTGTVFELTPSGGVWVESVLYAFPDARFGAFPSAPVIFDLSDDVIVTAAYGGSSGVGGILELVR